MFDHVADIRHEVDLKGIENFIALDALEGALRAVDRAQVSGHDAIAVQSFDSALRRRREGKRDGAVRGPDDDGP
jgi:hypothetical protein